MKLAKYQAGMGFVSWTLMIVLFSFVAMFVIRLTPVYMEYFTIRSVLHGFEANAAQYPTAGSVRDAVGRRFDVNNVKSIKATDVLIEPSAGGYAMQVEYEARVPFLANVSFVVNFSETGEVRTGSEFAQ